MQKTFLMAALAGFSALSAVALWQHGYLGIFAAVLATSASLQVFVDLVIALTLVMIWMWRDARSLGRSPWPWIAFTLLAGSFGPLCYLLTRPAPRS